MLEALEQTILSVVHFMFDKFGWLGVFLLMVLEGATGVSPGEVILTLSGWLLIESHGIPPSFILVGGLIAGLGSAIGASITYWVARAGGRRLVERCAKFFRIKLDTMEQIENQYKKWGAGIILVGRMIPGVRTFISIPAGFARIPFPKFFLASFIGAYIWCTTLIGAGYLLGHEWKSISDFLKTHLPFVLIVVLLLIAAYIVYHYRASISIPGWIRHNKEKLD